MTGPQLVEEGIKLSRPCIYLKPEGSGSPCGAWGGSGINPPGDNYLHWLTIDCNIVSQILPWNLPGSLSIYSDEDVCESGRVTRHTDGPVMYPAGSIPLFGVPGHSLPPIDAVIMHGSDEVQQWLKQNDWLPQGGWGPDEAYNDNFPDRVVSDYYERAWQARCPLYNATAFAMLGGWHMPWPEGDWYDLVDQTLVAWTFKDAEPWIEVWTSDFEAFTVIPRIT